MRNISFLARHLVRKEVLRRGMAGGMFKKNIYVEENAGVREKSYMTYEFDLVSVTKIFAYLIIPFGVVFSYAVEDLSVRDSQLGKKIEYGLLPPLE